MFLTPVSYGWKNPDRSQKEKTFTSNPGVAQPFVAQSDDRLQPKKGQRLRERFFLGDQYDASNQCRHQSYIHLAENTHRHCQVYHRFASYSEWICHREGSADKRNDCGQRD
jgi:hypothetical protein